MRAFDDLEDYANVDSVIGWHSCCALNNQIKKPQRDVVKFKLTFLLLLFDE